jgi:perosamine synthetase
MPRRIPVAAPALVGREKEYVLDALESGWISSNGPYIERFESAFARFCNVRHAVSCCNGTAALHAALLALGVGPGDEVIVPTLTFVATANAVAYCGARPVLADVEPQSWNLDPAALPALLSPRTKGIVPVHLYGHPAEMEAISRLARRHGLFIVEDAAEAHGATYDGRVAGSLGDLAAFSFYGNKLLTTGEGGMVVTDDARLAERARQFKGQGMDPRRRYWFPILGFNYRMTNLAAAIGVAQLEVAEWHLKRRGEVAAQYRRRLGSLPGIRMQIEQPRVRSAHWMTTVLLEGASAARRDAVMAALAEAGVETRPAFPPMHRLPMYRDQAEARAFPVADAVADAGISLPTFAALAEEDVAFVCDRLAAALHQT